MTVIRVNDASVIERFQDRLPDASAYSEDYLRAVARGIQECEPPVTMDLGELDFGGFRPRRMPCLVVEPTSPRLRYYKTAHYATPSGRLLEVGWYLVGGERANSIFRGTTHRDEDEVWSIIHTVHDYAVMPAMQEIIDREQFGNGTGGFAGV